MRCASLARALPTLLSQKPCKPNQCPITRYSSAPHLRGLFVVDDFTTVRMVTRRYQSKGTLYIGGKMDDVTILVAQVVAGIDFNLAEPVFWGSADEITKLSL